MDESFHISPENKKIVQVSIVVVILSMAIGNMFVVRRLKNVAKLHPFDHTQKSKASEVPFGDEMNNHKNYYKTHNQQSTSTSGNSNNASNKSDGRSSSSRQKFNGNASNKQNYRPYPSANTSTRIPAHIVHSLNTLGLPVTSASILPVVGDIKDAYHKLALKNHPDLLPINVEESRKQEHQKKFQIISAAYQDAMKYFEHNID